MYLESGGRYTHSKAGISNRNHSMEFFPFKPIPNQGRMNVVIVRNDRHCQIIIPQRLFLQTAEHG